MKNKKGIMTTALVVLVLIVVAGAIVLMGAGPSLLKLGKTLGILVPGFSENEVEIESIEKLRYDLSEDSVQYYDGTEWVDFERVDLGNKIVNRNDVKESFVKWYYDLRISDRPPVIPGSDPPDRMLVIHYISGGKRGLPKFIPLVRNKEDSLYEDNFLVVTKRNSLGVATEKDVDSSIPPLAGLVNGILDSRSLSPGSVRGALLHVNVSGRYPPDTNNGNDVEGKVYGWFEVGIDGGMRFTKDSKGNGGYEEVGVSGNYLLIRNEVVAWRDSIFKGESKSSEIGFFYDEVETDEVERISLEVCVEKFGNIYLVVDLTKSVSEDGGCLNA